MAASSASRSRRAVSRRHVRLAVAATGLAGALVLTGCSGDSDSGDDSTPSAGASSSADADPDGGTGGGTGGTDETGGSATSSAPAGELEGSWITTVDGKAVALMFTGEQAALFATGGTVCSGTTQEDAGTPTITLQCAGGDEERASGTVDSVSGSTLKVTWEGSLGTETYTKAEGGRLPSGLPTAGLGS
ncbi:hypothetical protein OH738_18025 [Streptomyces hirsutus]|uniref:hypothetical protein n=1 Tax=Streptomyces hirsutus TaxID=35620 RepID=UPI003865EAAD|nr:hypothetical protein OH738_18025 [Streptomyces hirsutus]